MHSTLPCLGDSVLSTEGACTLAKLSQILNNTIPFKELQPASESIGGEWFQQTPGCFSAVEARKPARRHLSPKSGTQFLHVSKFHYKSLSSSSTSRNGGYTHFTDIEDSIFDLIIEEGSLLQSLWDLLPPSLSGFLSRSLFRRLISVDVIRSFDSTLQYTHN